MLRRLTRFSTTHRWAIVACWTGVIVLSTLSAPVLFGGLTTDVGDIEGTESQRGEEALWQADPSGESIYAVADGLPVSDHGLRTSILSVADEIRSVQGVVAVRTPWTEGLRVSAAADPAAVATDARAVAVQVEFAPTTAGEDAVDPVAELLRSIDAPRVLVGGGPLLDEETSEQAAHDLARGEMLSTPVLLVLLLMIFGGLLAAGLPLVITLVSALSTLGALFLFGLVADVSVYTVNIVSMLGLGLAVDYALLIVSRYREERALRDDVTSAITATMTTAGRTVLFSGLTVAASLASLLVFSDDFLRSMGFAGLSVVLLDVAAALTLLPALLQTLGDRIKPARPRPSESGVLGSIAHRVARRPLVPMLVVTGVLITCLLPFTGARFADPDERSLPASSPSRQLAETADNRFAHVSSTDPITIVGPAAWSPSQVDAYRSDLRALDGVREVSTREGIPGLTVIDVLPDGDTQGEQAIALVSRIRHLDPGVQVEVTGDAAQLVDYEAALTSRLPYAIGFVVLASFALLFLFTGSVVIPLKALLLNTLSLGASFGALVWVFQDGHLAGLIGADRLDSLSITTPTLLFAIAYGLSMDYEVFLLGRITEIWRRTGDTTYAVTEGIRRTGRIVTAAALLMVVVYAGFVAGGFSPVKQLGLGLVLAVAVDATLTRMVLLPAVMGLLGNANWWAPTPLRRLHSRIGLADPTSGAEQTTHQKDAPPSAEQTYVDQALAGTGTSPR
jgi:putative drug exporter of the RND superfamily